MEAINSLASVATKAIWGENNNNTTTTTAADAAKDKDVAAAASKEAKEEPISGVQGDTSKGEPFDAGNMGNAEAAKKPDVDPAAGDKPSSHMKDDSTKIQSDVRDPKTDDAEHHQDEAKKDVDNVEPLNSDKLKGPGPKPLEQVARERGGDAGNAGNAKKDSSANPADAADGPKDEAEKKESSSNLNEDGEPLGQKHISSTGLAADGGDFDAANAGAGMEAEKILHDKGIRTEKPADHKAASPDRKEASPSGKSTSSSPDRKGLRGLGHKIKDKLRRGSQS